MEYIRDILILVFNPVGLIIIGITVWQIANINSSYEIIKDCNKFFSESQDVLTCIRTFKDED